jgi:hypothetical protein
MAAFIRALLEHVGAEINPIRLIRRIRDGLEIPGLKSALVKVLQASNLQVSLLEGCQHILNGDCSSLAADLQRGQVGSGRGSCESALWLLLRSSRIHMRHMRIARVQRPRSVLSLSACGACYVRTSERRRRAAGTTRECRH